MNPFELLKLQKGKRIDIIVRYMALDGWEDLYVRMNRERIAEVPEKLKTTKYIKKLCDDIKKNGIKKPVPINPDYTLQNGSHRMAIALYLGIDIPVKVKEHKDVRDFGFEWFEDHGFSKDEIDIIQQKYIKIRNDGVDKGYRTKEDYFNFIKNKNVILVGPANYLQDMGLGKAIDEYDLVVRMNRSYPVSEEYDLGSRTDILYISPRTWRKRNETIINGWRDISWIVAQKRPAGIFEDVINVVEDIVAFSHIEQTGYLKNEIGTVPNIGVVATWHILTGGAKSLHVVGCDFHQTEYHPAYSGYLNNPYGTPHNNRMHDIPMQLKFLSDLRNDYPNFTADGVLTQMIDEVNL